MDLHDADRPAGDAGPPAAELPEGRVVSNRYRLGDRLGQGGMGVVWRARDLLLDREVALKEVRLPPDLSRSERNTLHARVLREARAAAKLSHPAAVTVHDVVPGAEPWIVMEFVDAPSLASVVEERGPLPPREVAAMGLQLLDALEAAHRAGIVHRDVKPANVLLTADGRVKLTDFGVAAVQGDARLTMTGVILGSPAFMAPEQAKGEASGPAVDLWALGATLYFAVEGDTPFRGSTPLEVISGIVHTEPTAPRRAGPIAPVLALLLSKDPAARAGTERLRHALRRASTGQADADDPDGVRSGAPREEPGHAGAHPPPAPVSREGWEARPGTPVPGRTGAVPARDWYGAVPQPYPARPYGGAAPALSPSTKGLWALLMALFSFVVPLVPAVVALVLVDQARREEREEGVRSVHGNLVGPARVLAFVHLALVLPLLGVLVFIALVLAVPTGS